MDSATPGNTVSSESRPLAVVDTAGTEGLLQIIFVAFLRCPSVHGGRWKVRHTRLFWAGADPPFWRRALPNVAAT